MFILLMVLQSKSMHFYSEVPFISVRRTSKYRIVAIHVSCHCVLLQNHHKELYGNARPVNAKGNARAFLLELEGGGTTEAYWISTQVERKLNRMGGER